MTNKTVHARDKPHEHSEQNDTNRLQKLEE